MERITYTAPNLMDWVAQIKAGSATVKVHFSGGAITAYGVTPAEFTTENPFIQKVIERSTYFKEGRIQIGRKVEIPDPVKPKAKAQKPVSSPAPPAEPTETAAPIQETSAGAPAPVAETPPEEEAQSDYKEVEVSCLQDAQDYLQQNFGISSYKVRSKISAQKAAMERGVMFVGAGFGAEMSAEGTEAND